jgi:hypothetical protein
VLVFVATAHNIIKAEAWMKDEGVDWMERGVCLCVWEGGECDDLKKKKVPSVRCLSIVRKIVVKTR